ncbi:hypothetical protein SprV_0501818900 [Sparganum proliferum]
MTAKSARDDRKQYWAEIVTSMEQASNVGDTQKLYKLIRQVSGKPSTLSDLVRDVNGGFIADNSAKVERWREHFEHHLNFDTQLTSPLLSSSAEFPPSPTYAVPCDPPQRKKSSMPYESCATIRHPERTGCILSPILLNYAIDWILGRALRDSDGVKFAPGHRLNDLDYADDIALLASSFGDLQSMVSRLNEVAKSVGLSINAGKTKVFSSCIPDQEKAPLGIDGCQLEEVDSFKYLEARLLPNGQSKDDIISRIDAARWVFSSLRKCLWNRRDLSIATKIRVYRASLRSVLLYGCECWALRVKDERKLEVFDHHCLRIILRVKFTDFVSNETVRARCDNIARITQTIQERRLRWFGHVLRRPPQELSVTALDPTPLPHWRRRRRGRFKTWLDTVRQDVEVVLGPSVFVLRRWRREWVELSRSAAADRHAWRGIVRDIIEAG